MAFTDAERARLLHHLGYPHFKDYGLARGWGHPSAGPASDYVFGALDRVSPEGEQAVRTVLAELECVEREYGKLRSKAAVTKAADVSFDVTAARRMLTADHRRLVQQLSADLGAPINPHSRFAGGPRVRNMP